MKYMLGVVTVALLLAGAVRAQPASAPTSAPATQAIRTAEQQQRLRDLVSLIESPNTLPARRTGARELLHLDWPEVPDNIVRILGGPDPQAQAAIALALSDLPAAMRPEYIAPLVSLLASDDATARNAAAAALGQFASPEVIKPLAAVVADDKAPVVQRVAAISALGRTMQRDAIQVLVGALDNPTKDVDAAALAALEQATAQEFRDADQARQWWQQTRDIPLPEWQRIQLLRLAQRNNRLTQRVHDLQNRLTATLREAYFRLPEVERDAALAADISDAMPAVRLLGLDLAQTRLADGKPLSEPLTALIRNLLSDPEPSVRAAAARTVTALRDPLDAPRFVELISRETDPDVRHALINGLGYIGAQATIKPLLVLLDDPDTGSVEEAVGAIGRLAERGVLDDATRKQIADTFLARFDALGARNGTRVRLLWSMGRLADDRFGPTFAKMLNSDASATVRMAALRGLSVLLTRSADQHTPDPALVDALLPVTRDPDAALRRLAVETLAKVATTDNQIAALWQRAIGGEESDEAIRAAAWTGVVRVLAARPAEQILAHANQLPATAAAASHQRLELLQLAEKKLAADQGRRGLLGQVRAQIAARQIAAGQLDAGIKTYTAALADLAAGACDKAPAVALTLARVALLNHRYDKPIAEALGAARTCVDGAGLWEKLRDDINARMAPETIAQAIEMAAALVKQPPPQFDDTIRAELAKLLGDARKQQQAAIAEQVAAALVKLREKPDDATARKQIIDLGTAAVPALHEALRTVLSTEPLDTEAEQRLIDLLKVINPKWPGFPPEASVKQKLEILAKSNA